MSEIPRPPWVSHLAPSRFKPSWHLFYRLIDCYKFIDSVMLERGPLMKTKEDIWYGELRPFAVDTLPPCPLTSHIPQLWRNTKDASKGSQPPRKLRKLFVATTLAELTGYLHGAAACRLSLYEVLAPQYPVWLFVDVEHDFGAASVASVMNLESAAPWLPASVAARSSLTWARWVLLCTARNAALPSALMTFPSLPSPNVDKESGSRSAPDCLRLFAESIATGQFSACHRCVQTLRDVLQEDALQSLPDDRRPKRAPSAFDDAVFAVPADVFPSDAGATETIEMFLKAVWQSVASSTDGRSGSDTGGGPHRTSVLSEEMGAVPITLSSRYQRRAAKSLPMASAAKSLPMASTTINSVAKPPQLCSVCHAIDNSAVAVPSSEEPVSCLCALARRAVSGTTTALILCPYCSSSAISSNPATSTAPPSLPSSLPSRCICAACSAARPKYSRHIVLRSAACFSNARQAGAILAEGLRVVHCEIGRRRAAFRGHSDRTPSSPNSRCSQGSPSVASMEQQPQGFDVLLKCLGAIDMGVYTRSRLFRLAFCTKPGKDSPLLPTAATVKRIFGDDESLESVRPHGPPSCGTDHTDPVEFEGKGCCQIQYRSSNQFPPSSKVARLLLSTLVVPPCSALLEVGATRNVLTPHMANVSWEPLVRWIFARCDLSSILTRPDRSANAESVPQASHPAAEVDDAVVRFVKRPRLSGASSCVRDKVASYHLDQATFLLPPTEETTSSDCRVLGSSSTSAFNLRAATTFSASLLRLSTQEVSVVDGMHHLHHVLPSPSWRRGLDHWIVLLATRDWPQRVAMSHARSLALSLAVDKPSLANVIVNLSCPADDTLTASSKICPPAFAANMFLSAISRISIRHKCSSASQNLSNEDAKSLPSECVGANCEILYSIQGINRHCARVGRFHKSNHIYFVVFCGSRTAVQRCYDHDCSGFSSATMALPPYALEASASSYHDSAVQTSSIAGEEACHTLRQMSDSLRPSTGCTAVTFMHHDEKDEFPPPADTALAAFLR